MSIPNFSETPVESVSNVAARTRSAFHSHKTRPIEWRIKQLRALYWAIDKYAADLREAMRRDLGKGYWDAMIAEIDWLKNDIVYITSNLKKFAKDEVPIDIPLSNSLVKPRIRKDPLGTILVIGPFNFPIQLSIGPVIGAIAAGNTVVLKPSELTPNCAAMIQLIFSEALDPEGFTIVQGGIPQTTALLAEQWDKIFFTGSASTAKIVAKAAAVHLTPTVFELGGKNPAIVTRKANIPITARRLLWGKTMNAGQVCISQNYVLVDRVVLPTLIAELKAAYTEFYPKGAQASPDYVRIVNDRSFQRLKKMLDATSGEIVLGGSMDAAERFIEPTVITVNDVHDSLLAEESFGPFIPLLAIDDLDQAISIANSIHATPLGTYIFGSDEEAKKVLAETRSGGATINDMLFHAIIPTLQFGGVGDSGMGAYRGKESFDVFVHRRAIARTPNWMEKLLKMRYPPYFGTNKYEQFSRMGARKPNFDREGNDKVALWWFVLTLGGKSTTQGLVRAAMVVLAAVGIRKAAEMRK